MIQTDLWRVAIVKSPMPHIIAAGTLEDFETIWLPADGPLRFMADPFGLWKNGMLHVFVETYDYRTRHGEIELLIYDENLMLLERGPVLREAWHLSYPFVFEDNGEIWMLPEGYKSGRLSLYRAVNFPWKWEREERFTFPEAAIDATLVRTDKYWWMFYTPSTPRKWRTSALKLARADTLMGPWQSVGDEPILLSKSGARMGGTPLWQDGALLLPTQDCTKSYGGAISIQRISDLTGSVHVRPAGVHLTAPSDFHPYCSGLHSLSAAGPVTLVDAKQSVRSFHHLAVKAARVLGYGKTR